MSESKQRNGKVRIRFAEIDPKALTKRQKEALFSVAEKAAETYFKKGQSLENPDCARKIILNLLRAKDKECFGAIFLNQQHRVLSVEKKLFTGTISHSSVHPRVVVQKALKHRTAALVVFHNHPSGVVTPSQSDIEMTKTLKEALKLVDIRLLDHFIVGHESVLSLAEHNMI